MGPVYRAGLNESAPKQMYSNPVTDVVALTRDLKEIRPQASRAVR